MVPPAAKRRPLDILQDIVRPLLFPKSKEKSESFATWSGPHWGAIREQNSWLESRKSLEGAEGLWRIENGIYDLRNFISYHPGGRQWIELSKGTDITEMFKSHHLTEVPQSMLSKFYVRDAKTARNSPFTFHKDGFYEILRKRVADRLKDIPRGPSLKATAFADLLFVLTLITCWTTGYTGSYFSALLAAGLLCATTICAHNFFHQRDNWRMYYFQFSGLSAKGWRLSHAMSHHMFPNTQQDLEVAMFEPWLQWLTKPKNSFRVLTSWLYSPIVYTLILPVAFLVRFTVTGHDGIFEALPLVIPAAIMTGGGWNASFLPSALFLWAAIVITCSFLFGLVGLNAGHHHPELFHDGDNVGGAETMDWGFYQMITVKDRLEVRDSILGLISFGDHCLHHLFPAIDHSLLPQLYPDLRQTCDEFGLEIGGCSLWEGVKGQFLQLARVQKLSFITKHH